MSSPLCHKHISGFYHKGYRWQQNLNIKSNFNTTTGKLDFAHKLICVLPSVRKVNPQTLQVNTLLGVLYCETRKAAPCEKVHVISISEFQCTAVQSVKISQNLTTTLKDNNKFNCLNPFNRYGHVLCICWSEGQGNFYTITYTKEQKIMTAFIEHRLAVD